MWGRLFHTSNVEALCVWLNVAGAAVVRALPEVLSLLTAKIKVLKLRKVFHFGCHFVNTIQAVEDDNTKTLVKFGYEDIHRKCAVFTAQNKIGNEIKNII